MAAELKKQNDVKVPHFQSICECSHCVCFCLQLFLSFAKLPHQPWIFNGRIGAEVEAPILWPLDAKNQLTGKDPDAGKDWRQEEKEPTEDELVRWNHRLNGYEFEQTPGDSGGHGSLLCCSPWGLKESDTTEWTITATHHKSEKRPPLVSGTVEPPCLRCSLSCWEVPTSTAVGQPPIVSLPGQCGDSCFSLLLPLLPHLLPLWTWSLSPQEAQQVPGSISSASWALLLWHLGSQCNACLSLCPLSLHWLTLFCFVFLFVVVV